ncbi:MAG: hypothetical protein FJX72_16550, partial [Armatimonadetes bacterium]|nr:hypothetical protein [Armatimonadota bacterium]
MDAARESCPDRECARTLFLEQLLDDEERGRLAPLAHYVARFPGIEAFVQTEYTALCSPSVPPQGPAGMPAMVGRYQIQR